MVETKKIMNLKSVYHILHIILHLINSSNERPLFVPRDRPIFSRIGSKKVRIFFVLDNTSALYHCFSTIKAVDRKKYPNEKTQRQVREM